MDAIIPPQRIRTSSLSVKTQCLNVNHDTGSYPPLLRGWHRKILRAPRKRPLTTPYFITAEYVYSEHDGVKRHSIPACPVNTRMLKERIGYIRLYALKSLKTSHFIIGILYRLDNCSLPSTILL